MIKCKLIECGGEIYSDGNKCPDGYYIIDEVILAPNHIEDDKTMVAEIKAHLRENKKTRVKMTLDKFTSNAT